MRRARVVILLMMVLPVVLSGQSRAEAASREYSARVRLEPKAPVTVTPNSPVEVRVKFGHLFRDVEQICFFFEFSDDLLEGNDELMIDFHSPFGMYGFMNPNEEPQAWRLLCLIKGYHDQTLLEFLDGSQHLTIEMQAGSVRITQLWITLVGTAIV